MSTHSPTLHVVHGLIHPATQTEATWESPREAAETLPRLVGVSFGALLAYALGHAAVIHFSSVEFMPSALRDQGILRLAGTLFISYAGAFFAANCAALPSFYFFTLLAGMRAPPWRVALDAMRAQATEGVTLLGLLPIYVAAGLGLALIDPVGAQQAGPLEAMLVLLIGYPLPFIAGLAATAALLRSFRRLQATIPADLAAGTTPTLLALAWAGLFTVLAPMGVIRIFLALGGL